jgi:TRAP-type C4-dicarboxylate transport system permease small subunit
MRITKEVMMDEINDFTDIDLSTKQELSQALLATAVAFGASLATKKAFVEVVKVIRNRKASK